ncbi:AAA family ATPase [Saccharothrix longispora]|uniref:DNA-binding CsgD family transcriptional regulator n=1 Tax=Saccharothrix longispora TaxID=33920 RepID=A0ABU1PTM5_9PSEU|nr:AAA family ATPase [Saccharothrix longispora]MDR6594005.1 DNA-binding CsgD family transcriptional regulator [Saccharothrix longispora]
MWGRTGELEIFDGVLAAARADGAHAVVEIAGEPGIGKTRLLAALHDRALRAGVRVARGQATASPLTPDFALFVDALEELLAAGGDELLADLDPRVALWLPQVFPVLRPAHPAPAASPQQRYWAFQGIRQLLGRLAADAPLVLLLDDVHNAQPGSVEVLLHLLRRPLDAPLVLVLAHRPHQSPADLLGALATAAESGVARRLELGPLDDDSALLLLPSGIPPSRRRQLHRESGGKPGLLGALAAGPQDDAEATDLFVDGPDGVLPPGPLSHPVLASVRLDVQALPPLGQQVAQAAAVIGTTFDPALVAEVAGIDHDLALAGLDDLLARDLVRTAPELSRLRFRDPVVRSVCYHHAGGGWRLGAHARAYRALAERGAPLAELAHHLERAGQPATERDAETLAVAVAQSGDRMPAAVSRWLRVLLEPAGPGQAELTVRLARSTALGGHLVASLPEHRRAWRRVTELAPRAAADLVESHLRVLRLLGRFEDAAALVERIGTGRSGGTGDLDDPVAACAVLGFAEVALDSGGDVAGLLAPVGDLAEHESPRTVRAAAVHSAMLATVGRSADAAALADRVAAHLAEPGVSASQSTAVLCEAHDWLGWANTWSGRAEQALEQFGRGLALAERHHQVHVLGRLHLGLATAHLRSGALADAVEHAEDAGALAAAMGCADLQARTKRLCAEIGHVMARGGDATPGDSGALCAMFAGLSAAAGRRADARAWHSLAQDLGARPGLADRFGLTLLAVACLRWNADPERAWTVLRAAVVVLTVPPFGVLAPFARQAVQPLGDGGTPITSGDDEAHAFEKVVSARMRLLSARENQVAELVARGRTNLQIARALELSHKTVETYLRRIFDKLEVSSRSEVAAFTGIMPRGA